MVDQEGQAADRDDQELHSERIVVPIVGGLKLNVDQVHGGVRTSNVDDLKGESSDRNVSPRGLSVCKGVT